MAFSAILRDMPREDLIKELGKAVAEKWLDEGLFRTCVNCNFWQDGAPGKNEGCNYYQALPPPRVIAVGCEMHSDIIPF